ncbi:capsule assembly Wzi family protein [Daejeonella lutea]|uniref:Capsule assembly protein Wzi n=1 Tax=Daejeonella lutea TaxID=572036 RepID=A0A1T5FAL2_9SPHI|nr:capsule assembly Wzi family protein [Daejeonella lutea]SKB93223.1 Capsule assembly protein Wzi [Daejeonella lutea]
MYKTSSADVSKIFTLSQVLRRLLFFITLSFVIFKTCAQNLSANPSSFSEYYRRSQLVGIVDSTISFALRPLSLSAISDTGTILRRQRHFIYGSTGSSNNFQILPVFWQQQYHGNPTINRNDGLVIPAKGYQTFISAGAFAKFGPLRVHLRPEFIFAENKRHEVKSYHTGGIDLPSRFGSGAYSQATWGQSSIGLEFDPVSVSFSNENLWWGPGIQNSLLMSSSAAGFKHLTLNTNRPVQTPAGYFEAQVVAGRLEGSDFSTDLSDDWRYFSGFVFSYQPKWIPGLFLGLTRSFQIYHKDMDGSFGDIFPFLQAFQKINTTEDIKRRDQLISMSGRFLMPVAKSEVYFEYGLNDHSYNTRDFVMSPEHSRSYILGIQKLVPYRGRADEFIQFSAEITQMEQSVDRTIREAGEWYTHSEVLHGYTHRGEVLGAGIGPGGNLQSLQIGWVNEIKKLGLQLERFEHNGDLATAYGFSPWIDISMATVADWTFDNFKLSGKLQGIQSINYQWKDGINGRPKANVFNVNAQLGIMYSFSAGANKRK